MPTSSTIIQLSIGDALALSCMEQKKFGKLDFKKFHPGGNLSIKLKTVEDLMIKGKKIPFVNEESLMKNAIKVKKDMLAAQALSIMNSKKITSLCVHEKNNNKTVGIIHIHDILKANIQ